MSTSQSRKGARPPMVARAASVIAALAALTTFALIAHSTGHDDMAQGAIVGGAVTILAITALWAFGVRAGTPGRIVSGAADERDRTHVTAALADSAKAMALAALAFTIAALYGMPAPLVGGAILWAGLLTGLSSLIIRIRRG